MGVNRITILIVEDDGNIAELLGSLLAESGYETVHFYDANGAVEWIKGYKPQLIISDIGLPGISGTQFCSILKRNPATASIPIIMLTSWKDETHKVESLKTGADDYITKPFSNNELLARVEALLRRCYFAGRTDRLLTSGALTINADTGAASLAGKMLDLLPKELAILCMFLTHKEKILSYMFIRETVWGMDAVATKNTMKVTIHRLKSKLGRCAGCIQPVIGHGYKWAERSGSGR